MSWREPSLQGVEEDWLGARNYCRQRCMDLISLETSAENDWIKQRIVNENVSITIKSYKPIIQGLSTQIFYAIHTYYIHLALLKV